MAKPAGIKDPPKLRDLTLVRVKKADLKKALEDNRKKHEKEYKQAKEVRDIHYLLSTVYSSAKKSTEAEEQLQLILERLKRCLVISLLLISSTPQQQRL